MNSYRSPGGGIWTGKGLFEQARGFYDNSGGDEGGVSSFYDNSGSGEAEGGSEGGADEGGDEDGGDEGGGSGFAGGWYVE